MTSYSDLDENEKVVGFDAYADRAGALKAVGLEQ